MRDSLVRMGRRLLGTAFAVLAGFAMTACSSSSTDGGGGSTTVVGTLTLPAAAAGRPYAVLVDNDKNGDNGTIGEASGTCGSDTEQAYTINNVPAGTYYVYAAVGVVSNLQQGPQSGDYYGFYGTGGSVPGSPNATVPSSGTETFNITLVVM